MRIRPLHDLVVVQRDGPDVMAGDLHIPLRGQDVKFEATVLDMSDQVAESGEISIGDRVMVDWYHGTEMVVDGRRVNYVHVDDVLLVMEQTAPLVQCSWCGEQGPQAAVDEDTGQPVCETCVAAEEAADSQYGATD